MEVCCNKSYGYIKVNLKDIMDEKNITINQMSRLSKLRYETVRKYYKEEVYLLDIDVLTKFCYFLDCEIDDLLVYNKETAKKLTHV